MSIQRGIVDTAQALGMSPTTLATIISYETAGTFDPTKKGPTTKWGQHRGFIQFGEPQAKQYGVDWSDPVNSQLGANGAVAKYFRASGWKPGMNEMQAYSIVNAGAPNKFNASDTAAGGAPGTVRDKVLNQFAPHRAKAQKLMGGEYMPSVPRQQQKAVSDDDFADIFGGEWKPSNRFAKKTEQKSDAPNAPDIPNVDDLFAGSWQPSRRYGNPQQAAVAEQPTAVGGFNPNPTAKRETLTAADAPQRDFLTDVAMGGYRGIKDVGAGLVGLNESLAAINPLANIGGMGKYREQAAKYVDDANRADIERYKAGGYDQSGAAGFGRFAGNVMPLMVPGMQGVRTESLLPRMANAGVVGAAQNTVIGTGRNPDADKNTLAAQGAMFGVGGSAVGSSIGKGIARMAGAVTGNGQQASNTAIKKLLDASAPNLDDMTAAARLQGAIQRGNTTLVPGASPTLPQAAMLPGISQVRRDVINHSPANALVDREAMQDAARLSSLGGISDVSGLTAQDAAQSAGQQIGGQIRGAHQAVKTATGDLYQSPALQSSVIDTSSLGQKLADIYKQNFTVGGKEYGGNAILRDAANILDGQSALPYQQLQNVRKTLSGFANDYSKDSNLRRVAKNMLDEVDGSIDSLPGALAAKASRAEQGRLYESGIVGDITGKKGSGEYRLTEDAIPRKLLSTSPGQTARMQQFNAVADQPSKDAAKQAFMADLLERSGRNLDTDAARLLPSKLTGYTQKRSGTMQEMFTPEELAAITNVTSDAKRAAAAVGLGMGAGSNTVQNLHGALNLGLLDNPLLNSLSRNTAGRVPLAGDVASAAVSGIKNSQRQKLANELADLLSNPEMTDKAIAAYIKALRGGQAGGKAGGLLSVPATQGLLDDNGFRKY